MNFLVASLHAALAITEIKTALLDGGKMLCYQNDYTPNSASTEADYVEATFTGYTAGGETLTTWSDYYDKPAGAVAVLSPTINWNAASPFTVTNDIFGVYVLDSNGDYVGGVRFSSFQQMGAAGDAIHFAVEYVYGQP